MPDCVANVWREIWQTDYPRNYQYDFEIYSAKSFDWSNAEVDVFIGA
jgi:predicted transcriptional regulator YdeE